MEDWRVRLVAVLEDARPAVLQAGRATMKALAGLQEETAALYRLNDHTSDEEVMQFYSGWFGVMLEDARAEGRETRSLYFDVLVEVARSGFPVRELIRSSAVLFPLFFAELLTQLAPEDRAPVIQWYALFSSSYTIEVFDLQARL